jgi:hypothetical protein
MKAWTFSRSPRQLAKKQTQSSLQLLIKIKNFPENSPKNDKQLTIGRFAIVLFQLQHGFNLVSDLTIWKCFFIVIDATHHTPFFVSVHDVTWWSTIIS